MNTITKEEAFTTFPFTFDGREYVSKVALDSPLIKRIATLPLGMFEQMNAECLEELMGKGKSREEIEARLVELNENGSFAFIELV
jgi:hypothetical protein